MQAQYTVCLIGSILSDAIFFFLWHSQKTMSLYTSVDTAIFYFNEFVLSDWHLLSDEMDVGSQPAVLAVKHQHAVGSNSGLIALILSVSVSQPVTVAVDLAVLALHPARELQSIPWCSRATGAGTEIKGVNCSLNADKLRVLFPFNWHLT